MTSSGNIYIEEGNFGAGFFDFYRENKILYLKKNNKDFGAVLIGIELQDSKDIDNIINNNRFFYINRNSDFSAVISSLLTKP